MDGRHGQISLQFNWIFVLIIGAVILAFFLTIINNQEERADAEQATEMSQTVESVLTAISTNPDTVETFTLRESEIRFFCEEDYSAYQVRGQEEPLDREVIFAPRDLKGEELIMWTHTWQAPFPAMVVSHLASERVMFLFVTTDGNKVVERLHQDMPKEFTTRVLDEDDLDDVPTSGYDRYVIITTNSGVAVPSDIEEKAVIRVIPETADRGGYKTRTITFKDGTGSNEETKEYVTTPMLWGAIFTEDASTFSCTVAKARTRHRMLSAIINDRLDRLQSELEDTSCGTYLGSAGSALDTLESGKPLADPGVTKAMRSVESANELIKRGPRCPQIY